MKILYFTNLVIYFFYHINSIFGKMYSLSYSDVFTLLYSKVFRHDTARSVFPAASSRRLKQKKNSKYKKS